jgi:enoyl-CoA hydratase
MGIEFAKEGHIARVGINVPETKNALSTDMLVDLYNVWAECQSDENIRSVLVYSVLPDIFCSGMDIRDSIPLLTGRRPLSTDNEKFLYSDESNLTGFSKALLKVRDLVKPVIAAINGYCITGGFELAMGSDLRIATEDAKFQMRETRLGIQPMSGGNIFLPAIVGDTRALEILLTGDAYPASKMLEWGFLNKVVPTKKELMEEALALAEKLAGNGPKSQRGIVKLNRLARGLTLEDAFRLEIEIALPVFRSNDPVEGINAQKEKRKANFEN